MRLQRNTNAIWPLLMAALLSQSCSDTGESQAQQETGAEAVVEQNTDPAAAPQDGEEDAALALPGGEPRTLADLLREYEAQCPPTPEPSLDCEWLRSLLVADTVERLEMLERSHDQRATQQALLALDVVDEPEILIAACRILGEFADTPGIAEKVAPLLDSPWLEVQRLAAPLLGEVPNGALNSVGYRWSQNHQGAPHLGPYDELEFPEHYQSMGFPEYPGSERSTLGDSDRSIGWWSPDPAATVASRLGEAVGATTITSDQWTERVQQQMASAAQGMIDPLEMAEIEKLTEQYLKKQDEALLKRIQEIQQKMAASFEQAGADSAKGVEYVAVPSASAVPDQIFYLIPEEKGGHPARVILVYRQPVLERTVIQMAWDLRDYPSAWPEPGAGG